MSIDEQDHYKIKHTYDFDKNRTQRLNTNFLSIKLSIRLIHARSRFQSKYSKNFTFKMASCMYKLNI